MIQFTTKLKVNTKPISVAHADQLRHQLARIAVEQARHRAVHAVPGAAVVTLAVGEQAHRDDAPESVGAVDRDGAHRIVDLHDFLDELNREAHQHAGDQSDDDGADGFTKPLGAVIATSPARRPLPVMEASGLP